VGAGAGTSATGGPVTVVLEFDNASISEYTLGYLDALQPHGAKATFFVNSGTVGASSNFMSWSQLGTVAAAGNDVGGKSVNATNLTTDPNPTAQVCNDRAQILSHGLTPVGFAYPGGANNATVQGIVQSCGYGSARTAGGISTSVNNTPETLPPGNWLATKAYAPAGVTNADLQTIVTNAFNKGGGFVQVVVGRVCDQALDQANYSSCSTASGHMELSDLNNFLTWMGNAGQAGGAPAGAVVTTLGAAYKAVDTSAPTTTIACNAAPCASTPYTDVVSVTLSAIDAGTGVSSTHYTVDGSDPTLNSPTYTGPFNVNGSGGSTTVKFRSWDIAGNAEATQTQVIQAPADTAPPTTAITCNSAACGTSPYVTSVTIGLTATDTGGSGVDKTYYTTDGSTPTTASTVYTGAFQVTSLGTTTVRFFSTDKAGNAETPQSQSVKIVPVATRVALTFDNGSVGQYSLGYQKALQPHNAKATFYVNSSTSGVSGSSMTWAQLGALAAAGNDIGGKSSSTNLTTDPDPTSQICNDRAALVQHGLDPIGFAWPGGAVNATVEGIAKSCGYGIARTAGSLSPTGPTYAETLPPNDWYATRAYAPGGQVTLANMEALVTGAAAHGGGLSQIVITQVCDQTLDPNNYSTCSAAAGHVELSDLNAFLDWMGNAGQSGGAPAGAVLSTVRSAAISADTIKPSSTATCNGAPCASGTYTQTVTVALSATDVGSGVQSIRYTTDGSTPTASSTAYTQPIVITSATTLTYRAFDHAGNAEDPNTVVVSADVSADKSAPTTAITCNNAACATSPYVASVTIALTPTDTGGSGVDKTYYTTDGSTPTLTSPVYTAPFQVTALGTTKVQFFSTDRAGNVETVQSQQVDVVATPTRVALTFDNGTAGQYTLAYLNALQPHNAHASFYVNTSTIGVSANSMTWAQLGTLAAAGNDIGGKSNSTNLTTDSDPTSQICSDRAALVQHGLDPVGFAWPGGAFNATVEGIAKSCGYGVARSAGSLNPAGPTYAETLPPKDWYATRAWAPTGQVTLANMEALVTGAASHGGGLSQIVIARVCDNTLDPGNYTSCTASAGWVELADLNAFLDWMGNAGQNGGAPAGAVLSTVRDAAISADTIKPATTAACNGATCTSDTYTQTVYVTLSGTDVGSAVQSIRYTTDGSTPTASSPSYTAPIPVTGTTTLTYRAFDHAGNAEDPNTVVVNANLAPDSTPPTTTIACDGAPCGIDGYNGSTTVSLSADDGSGWGVDKTYYTTDGSTPTTSSTVYSAPFKLSTGTYTVQWFSTDLAGNVESVESQKITVLDPKVVVSLTFDDGLLTQYTLADKLALKPHGLRGTFYDVTGLHNDEQHMSWQQLTDLNNDGNEIGAHTVHHVSLKGASLATDQTEACGSYNDLVTHGFYPTSFAYPTGAYDAQAETVVQSCGFTSGRAAGGIDVAGEGQGPLYAETIPPKDPFALRTLYDQPEQAATGPNVPPLTLAHLQAAVTGAASHGGGWVPLVFHDICSQQYDPDNYSFCINDWGPIELSTLNSFLDWLQASGQPGGAPPRTVVETVSQVMNGPDTQAPITTLDCNHDSPCTSTAYAGSVTVDFDAKDPGGSGVKATYYTTDGSTPTTSSPTAGRPFTINSDTTFKFFSVDNSGNTEPVQTVTVQATPRTDPIVGAAGDIACDPNQVLAFYDAQGTATDCRAVHTASLLEGADAVLPLGDNQYFCGGAAAYAQSYDRTWGPLKSITHPVPGDADYATSGGTDCPGTPGKGYYDYFGAAAGDPTKGYYSYDIGQWHVVAINTAPCETNASTCSAGSAQETWLRQDLAANNSPCTLAYYQNPRFTSTSGGGNDFMQAIWQDLYDGGVEVVLNGDSHWYERFMPVNAAGQADNAFGVREFIVGTGGQGLDNPAAELPISQVINNTTHGVIKLTLHSGSYDWTFVPTGDEGSFTDSGSASCHGKPTPPDTTPPTTTVTCNGTTCTNPYTTAVQVSLAATDNTGGSGVKATYYTTDGSTPTTSSTLYSAPFTVSATSTVRYLSVDNAGNAESPQSQLVQITTDTTAPTTTIACNGAACGPGYTSSVQVSLAATDDTGGSGVKATYYTTDGSTPTTGSTLYSAPFTVAATSTVKFFSIDNAGNAESLKSQQIILDTAAPTTSVSCNGGPCAGTYTSAVQVSLSATDNTGGSGVKATYYTTDGTTPTTSSTPYIGPFFVAATSTVAYFSIDNAGNAETPNSQQIAVDATAPTTTVACNGAACSAGFYAADVQVSLAATDNTGGSGVKATYYTTDGSTPTTSSTQYTGPLTVSATSTVKFFSVDKLDNAETPKSQLVQIDRTAPTTAALCNGAACAAWYTSSVQVTLTSSDAGGSGVAATYYTTNGTTPTTASTKYTGSFTISATRTVKYFSVDALGNAEAVKSQLIQIDSVAPTATIACNGTTCGTGWYTAPVSVTLSATDNAGGSGVAAIYYTTDGSTPTTSSTRYTGFFSLSKKTSVKYFAVDVAGKASAVKTQSVQVDVAAPATAITCNGATCSTGWYNASVTVRLNAADPTGGSGVAATYYTTDGTTPTTASTKYSGRFTVTATGTVKFFSVDVAGNVEPVESQTIQIDTAAPTTAILCNGASCASSYSSSATVTLAAVDTGGSGVASTHFTTNGTTPTLSSPTYTGPLTLRATTTVKFRSWDAAGNVETVRTQKITITP
jgi:peptidoglycan/xylan/chitin deacetylase (PgdA/CDA1 family)